VYTVIMEHKTCMAHGGHNWKGGYCNKWPQAGTGPCHYYNLHNVEVEVAGDGPDYCDSFVSYAERDGGIPLLEEELEFLSDNQEYVHKLVYDSLH